MQTTELLRLIEWFKSHIVAEAIPMKYSKLSEKLTHNSSSNNQAKQAYKAERQALLDSLKKIDYNALSIEQIAFLKKLSIYELLGESGIKKIEQVLFENNLDIATAAKEIGDFAKKIGQANNTFNKIYDALSPLFNTKEEYEIQQNSVLMRIYFQQQAAINNISDFKKLSSNWYDISRGIAMAINKTPEDFFIVGASKGSIIFDLIVVAGIATTVSKILLESLKVAEKTVDILKKVEELKALRLNNKQIEADLIEESKLAKEQGVHIILTETVTLLEIKEDQGDVISALTNSISKLIEFTQNGGQVDFVQPESDKSIEPDETKTLSRKEISKLKENIAEIRKLESKIKLLTAGENNEQTEPNTA